MYTIGHSSHSFEHFAELLRQHRIVTVVDVRSKPYSKHVPHFQKQPLSDALAAEDVAYVFLGDKLGGKLGDRYRDPSGRIDYRRRSAEPDFREGLEELIVLAAEKPTAIMCAEEDPSRCHRRRLVTPVLVERGIEVLHIRGSGKLESEETLGEAPSQMSLF